MPALYHSYQFVFGKKIGVVKFHPAFSRLLVEANDVKDVIHGRMLPMLVPPRPWLTFNSGGYLTVNRTSCLFGAHRAPQAAKERAVTTEAPPPPPGRLWSASDWHAGSTGPCMRVKESPEQLVHLREADQRAQLDDILAALDVLGSTSWKINGKVRRAARAIPRCAVGAY